MKMPATRLVSAAHPALHFEGRLDRRNPAAPVFIWQGSSLEFSFTGDFLALRFGGRKGSAFFDLTLEAQQSMIEVKEGAEPVVIAFSKELPPGSHRVTLFKRSEADAGYATLDSIELSAGGKLEKFETATPKLRLHFFGDSITVGACDEDGAVDQWESRATHNNAFSYAALTAKAFGAGYRNTAVSGMGIVEGYVPKIAGQIWDRLYPEIDSPKADENGWEPDLVFVNYGENDDSFTKNAGTPFPKGFTEGYVDLVRAMRQAYPKAEIILLRGGMSGGAKSERLRLPWESAVQQLKATDPHVHHFVFQHWSELHPRVSDQRAMADELIGWLRAQPFVHRLVDKSE
ncbi:MAG: SGNH/GDSL hydrolase family protein [Nibricoccus sp.]